MRDYKLYLRDILEAISRMENSMKGITKEVFQKDVDIQDLSLRRLEVIGEAVTNISEEIKSKYSDVEWKEIAGFRVVVAHTYFKINLNIVWDIIKNELPKLKREIENILGKDKE